MRPSINPQRGRSGDLRLIRATVLCFALASMLALAACAPPASETPSEEAAATASAPVELRLVVENARVQLMPDMGAAYLLVKNPREQADQLLRVTTDAARGVETHESYEEDGVMRMRHRPEGFEVPAQGDLALEPGGKHLMLIEPSVAADAQTLDLTLHFRDAGSLSVRASVKRPGDSPEGMDHGDMDHSQMDHGDMDHGDMDHSQMDHGDMDHGDVDHGDVDHSEPGAGEHGDGDDGASDQGVADHGDHE